MTVARVAPVVVALVLLAATLAPVAAGAGSAEPGPVARVTADDPGRTVAGREVPRFVDAPYREHRGDVVRVPVAVPFGGASTVTLRGNGTEYAASVTLRDGNGDGLVTLVWNTYLAGSGSWDRTFRAAAPGDAVENATGTAPNGTLPAGSYGLAASSPTTNTTDVATVRLTPPGPVGVDVLRGAPSLAGNLTDIREIDAARGTGDLSAAYSREGDLLVAPEEVLVLELRVPGLAGALAAADGSNATARFRSLLGSGLSVGVSDDEATVDAEEEAVDYRLREASGYRVVPDPGSDTYYLVLGTSRRMHTAGPDPPSDDVDLGDVFRFEVSVAASRGTPANRTATVEFVEGGSVGLEETEDDRLPPAAANGTVAGSTTLRPGQRVTVRLESPAGDPFPLERTVRVGRDGRFEAAFDLSAATPGTEFEAVVRRDGRTTDWAAGVVGPVARVRFEDREVDLRDLRSGIHVDAVYTTAGGFVAFRRGSADGPVVGVSPYLPPGRRLAVDVPIDGTVDGDATLVAVAHRDADGDRAFDAGADPVYAAGTPTAVARIVVDGTPTVSPPPPTATPSPTVTQSATATGRPPDGPGVPGFGPVVAVVALAAALAAALVTRRSEGGDGA